MRSARVLICCSPNMSFRSEKTRSHDAEFGEMAKTMRTAKHKKRIVSAVSARIGPTLLAAGGQISLEISGIVVSFEGSDFQKNF